MHMWFCFREGRQSESERCTVAYSEWSALSEEGGALGRPDGAIAHSQKTKAGLSPPDGSQCHVCSACCGALSSLRSGFRVRARARLESVSPSLAFFFFN